MKLLLKFVINIAISSTFFTLHRWKSDRDENEQVDTLYIMLGINIQFFSPETVLDDFSSKLEYKFQVN